MARLRTYADIGSFDAVAGAFLLRHEAEHCLQLGLVSTLRDRPEIYQEPPYLATVDVDDAVQLVAMRTPPWNLVLSLTERPELVDLVMDDVATGGPLPGVVGPETVAARAVAWWSARTGRTARVVLSERIYRLDAVTPTARPVPGRWRVAGDQDRGRLSDWLLAFEREALPDTVPTRDREAVVARWVRREGRWVGLWEVDGRVVSMAGAGSATPNGIRIGPVYTPRSERRRGYASAVTAAVCQAELDTGRRLCFLFADLANPTPNHIYQEIGFRPVADVQEWAFDGG